MGIAYGTTTLHQATKGIVQDGLVLNLDAGVRDSYSSGSTVVDLTGTQNATLENQVTFNKEKGGIFSLDGTDDYLSIGALSTILPAYTAFTISIWVKPDASASTSTAYSIIAPWSNVNFFLSIYPSNSLRFYIRDTASGNFYIESGSFISNYAGQWKHIVATCSGANAAIYLDSSVSASTSSLVSISTNTTLQTNVGASRTGTSTWFGEIGPVQIYNRALTAAEVSKNFNVMRHRFGI